MARRNKKSPFWATRLVLRSFLTYLRTTREAKEAQRDNQLREAFMQTKIDGQRVKNARLKEQEKQDKLKTQQMILKNQLLEAQIEATKTPPINHRQTADNPEPPKHQPNGIPATWCPRCKQTLAATFIKCPNDGTDLINIKI